MFPVTLSFTVNSAEQLAKLGVLFAGAEAAPKAETKPAPKAQPVAEASTKSTTASPTTPPAAAQGANEGNVSATATSTGSAAQESQAASAGAAQEAPAPAEVVTFDELKKAFLSLSTKEGGRAKCEGVLKPHGLNKLSEAKEEQYNALLAAIKTASE